MAKKISKIQLFRRIVLGVMLSGFLVLIVLHDLLPNMPSVDSLCPFGGLETLMKWLASGEFLKHITPSNIVLFGAVVVLGIVLSRFFCGWLCAFGALQGVFGWIGKKIFKNDLRYLPKWIVFYDGQNTLSSSGLSILLGKQENSSFGLMTRWRRLAI